jgi:pyruvate dehydrogenase E2 component (dihydrolipoamide acetyltransferase)
LNIGLAISVQGGVIVPVIRQANLKSLAEITLTRAALVDRARKLRIEPHEVEGASITLTNIGMFGVEFGLAIINPPESCILAIGRIREKPVVHHGEIAIRPIMNLGLSFDHRVADGVMASRFLLKIKEIIEQPGSLMSKV